MKNSEYLLGGQSLDHLVVAIVRREDENQHLLPFLYLFSNAPKATDSLVTGICIRKRFHPNNNPITMLQIIDVPPTGGVISKICIELLRLLKAATIFLRFSALLIALWALAAIR